MKTKKYVLFQLRSWLPMIIAFGALVLTTTVIIGLNSTACVEYSLDQDAVITYTVRYAIYRVASSPVSCIVPMMIPSIIASFVLPFFAYSHRYGKTRADCFLSLPVKSGKITQIRMLLAGAILLAIYLVSFLLGSLAAIAKQSIQAATAVETLKVYFDSGVITEYSVITGAFGWYFAAWPIGAVIVLTLFLINSFLAGQGSNVLQGIIATVCGHAVIALFFPLIVVNCCFFQNSFDAACDFFGVGISFFHMPSFYVPLILIEGTLGNLEANTAPNLAAIKTFVSEWGIWFGSIGFLALGGFALAHLLLGKEPGGEFVGESRPRNFFATLLPHLAFFAAFLGANFLMGSIFTVSGIYVIFLFLADFVWTGGLYYVVISLYNHSFKLDAKNWIIFGCVNFTAFIIVIATFFSRYNLMR